MFSSALVFPKSGSESGQSGGVGRRHGLKPCGQCLMATRPSRVFPPRCANGLNRGRKIAMRFCRKRRSAYKASSWSSLLQHSLPTRITKYDATLAMGCPFHLFPKGAHLRTMELRWPASSHQMVVHSTHGAETGTGRDKNSREAPCMKSEADSQMCPQRYDELGPRGRSHIETPPSSLPDLSVSNELDSCCLF
jgi:hypothetical protein